MKKIIFTVTNDLNFDQRMIRICSSMQRHGYDVLLVGRLKSKSKPIVQQTFQQERLNCFFQSGKFFYLEYNIRLFFFLLTQKTNIICAIDLDTIVPGYFVARLKGNKIVYDAHEYFTESPEIIERPFVKKIWSIVANSFIPRIEHAYTVCQSLATIFEKNYHTKFQVIRNVPFFRKLKIESNNNSSNKIVLYQGVLNEGRGIEELFHAIQDVNGLELWLAGEGDLSHELRELAIELNINDKVKFLGFVLPRELTGITDQADIGLNLLKNKGLNYYYSLANKAFDYIQSEIPSINMDFPEYQLLNKSLQTSVLVKDLKSKTLKDAIEKLIQDEKFYQTLKLNCQKAKLELNWEKEEKKLIEFYNSI